MQTGNEGDPVITMCVYPSAESPALLKYSETLQIFCKYSFEWYRYLVVFLLYSRNEVADDIRWIVALWIKCIEYGYEIWIIVETSSYENELKIRLQTSMSSGLKSRDHSGNAGSANAIRRYIVTPPLIGWAHTQNDTCENILMFKGAVKSWRYDNRSDVTRESWRLNSPATRLLVQQLVRSNIITNIKARHFWPIENMHVDSSATKASDVMTSSRAGYNTVWQQITATTRPNTTR